MSKDFTRGVTVGEGNAVKEETQVTAQQAVKEYETSEEDTRALIRANEEDFIQGLIDAAEFASEETQRIEIIREGRLLVSDTTESLGHTDTRRVRLSGVGVLPELTQVKDIQTDGDSISFLYGGDLNILLRTLSELPLTDISITEPDLEEIFMHYYGTSVKKSLY